MWSAVEHDTLGVLDKVVVLLFLCLDKHLFYYQASHGVSNKDNRSLSDSTLPQLIQDVLGPIS